jgi:hypothetical protein
MTDDISFSDAIPEIFVEKELKVSAVHTATSNSSDVTILLLGQMPGTIFFISFTSSSILSGE